MIFRDPRAVLGVFSAILLFSMVIGAPVYLAPSGETSWDGECDNLLCNSSFPCSIPSSSMVSQLNGQCDIIFSEGDYSNAHLQWSSNAKLLNLTFGFSSNFLATPTSDDGLQRRLDDTFLSALSSGSTDNLKLTLHLNAENVNAPGSGPLEASFLLHGISAQKHATNSVTISLEASGDLDAELYGLSFSSSSVALKSPGSAEADFKQCDFVFGSQSNTLLDLTNSLKAEIDFDDVSVVGSSTSPSFIKGNGNISIEFEDSVFNGAFFLESTTDSAAVKLEISGSNVSYSGSSLISVPQNSILEVHISGKSILRSLDSNRVAITQWKSCSKFKLRNVALTGLDMSVTSGKIDIDSVSCDNCDFTFSYPTLNATIQNSNFSMTSQGSLILRAGPDINDGSFSFKQVQVWVGEEGVSRKPFQVHRHANFKTGYSFGESLVTNMLWLGSSTEFHVEELTLTEYAGSLDSTSVGVLLSDLPAWIMHKRKLEASHASEQILSTNSERTAKFWTFHSVRLENVYMLVDRLHYIATKPMAGIESSYMEDGGNLPSEIKVSWGAEVQPLLGVKYPIFRYLAKRGSEPRISLEQDAPLRGLKPIGMLGSNLYVFVLVPSNFQLPRSNMTCPVSQPDNFVCIEGVLVAFQDINVEDIEFPPNPVVIYGNLKVEEDIEFRGIWVDLNVTGCIEADSVEFKFEDENPAKIVPENSPIVIARQSPSCTTSLSNIKLKTDQNSKYCRKVVATHTPTLINDGTMTVTFRFLKCPAPVGWIVLGIVVGIAVICAIAAGIWWVLQGKKSNVQSHAESFQPMDSEELQDLD